MAVAPGEKVYKSFPTYSSTGANEDVDSLPVGSLIRKNVTDPAVTVTIVRKGVGDYAAEWVIPSTYKDGDDVQLRVDVVKNGEPSWDTIWQDVVSARSGTQAVVITVPTTASSNIPAYNQGDVVYLRESAQIGHLEAVKIASMTYRRGQWLYTINASQSMPVGNTTYSDRVNIVNGGVLFFSQSEFVDVCSALRLVIAFHQSKEATYTAKLNSLCG